MSPPFRHDKKLLSVMLSTSQNLTVSGFSGFTEGNEYVWRGTLTKGLNQEKLIDGHH